MKPHFLTLENIAVRFNGKPVLGGLSFHLEKGEIGCVLGPSGSGKTTLLRAILGFESLCSGKIFLKGAPVSTQAGGLAPEKRRIGIVFQDYALFPHLSNFDNIAFGLRRFPKEERKKRVTALLGAFGIERYGTSFPHEISGGEQQRVALARAIAQRPDLLLLDEPFSNLDGDLKERVVREICAILKSEGITTILVTHDQNEAFDLADRMGILYGGHLLQWDTPYNLYHKPISRFVADFVGQGVFLPGKALNEREIEIELGVLRDKQGHGFKPGTQLEVLLRPDDAVHDPASPIQLLAENKVFRGGYNLYMLRLPSGKHILSLIASHFDYAPGAMIGIRLAADHVVAFE